MSVVLCPVDTQVLFCVLDTNDQSVSIQRLISTAVSRHEDDIVLHIRGGAISLTNLVGRCQLIYTINSVITFHAVLALN